MSDQFDPQEVFADPVAYLQRFGIEATVVDPAITLPEAA